MTMKLRANVVALLATVMVTTTILPTRAHGGEGGDGSGGGNVDHVSQQSKDLNSNFSDFEKVKATNLKNRNDAERARARQKANAQLVEVTEYLKATTDEIMMWNGFLKAMKYPFSQQFKSATSVDVTDGLRMALETDADGIPTRVSIDNNLKLNGKPITFISYPESKSIVVNYNLLLNQTKTNSEASVVATVFHEALRLLNIEGSDSYPYTREYAAALQATYSNEFHSWLRTTDLFKCMADQKVYSELQMNFEDMEYSYETIDSAILGKYNKFVDGRNRVIWLGSFSFKHCN